VIDVALTSSMIIATGIANIWAVTPSLASTAARPSRGYSNASSSDSA